MSSRGYIVMRGPSVPQEQIDELRRQFYASILGPSMDELRGLPPGYVPSQHGAWAFSRDVMTCPDTGMVVTTHRFGGGHE
jgi:hypothetical protein